MIMLLIAVQPITYCNESKTIKVANRHLKCKGFFLLRPAGSSIPRNARKHHPSDTYLMVNSIHTNTLAWLRQRCIREFKAYANFLLLLVFNEEGSRAGKSFSSYAHTFLEKLGSHLTWFTTTLHIWALLRSCWCAFLNVPILSNFKFNAATCSRSSAIFGFK